MKYLFDTNILLHYIRESPVFEFVQEKYRPLKTGNTPLISVASIAKIKSFAAQLDWGEKRQQKLEALLPKFLIIDIRYGILVERYVQIDVFSQGKLSGQPLGTTPRNMGKNDLWIAATASALQATLLTTDKDFDHLHWIFLDLARV